MFELNEDDELSKLSLIRGFSQVILSDDRLKLQEKLNIPIFQVENKTMYKRLTLILKDSEIIKVFYPVFPPDKHIFEILEWLENYSTN
jgi:peroxiredoxin